MLHLKLPDSDPVSVHPGTSFGEIAESFGPGFAKTVVAAAYDGKIYDLNQPLPDDGEPTHDLRFLTPQDPDALGVLRHSTAHILGCAILRLFPGTQLGFGPATEAGFYYDVDTGDRPLTEDDFPAIEAEMAKIIKENRAFERFELPTDDARDLVGELGESYKVEHIRDELHKFPSLSFYRLGEFIDLCRGPHIPSTNKVGAVKLLSIAGAYWKAHTDRKMLQRVYGTAFFTKGRPQGPPRPDRRGEEAGPPEARQGPRPVHDLAARRLRPHPLDAQGRDRPRPAGSVPQGRAGQARLPAGLHAAHRQDRPVPDQRALSLLQGLAVPADPDAFDDAAMALIDGLEKGHRSTTRRRRNCSSRPPGSPRSRHGRGYRHAGPVLTDLEPAARIGFVTDARRERRNTSSSR